MLSALARIQPRELHTHFFRGSQLNRSTLRQELEQLHQAWPRSGLARVGPTSMRKPLSRPERDDCGTSQTSIRRHPPWRNTMKMYPVAPIEHRGVAMRHVGPRDAARVPLPISMGLSPMAQTGAGRVASRDSGSKVEGAMRRVTQRITSSSAGSGIRQLVRGPRQVSPPVGSLALTPVANGAGPTSTNALPALMSAGCSIMRLGNLNAGPSQSAFRRDEKRNTSDRLFNVGMTTECITRIEAVRRSDRREQRFGDRRTGNRTASNGLSCSSTNQGASAKERTLLLR
jgi:hypothetical protein